MTTLRNAAWAGLAALLLVGCSSAPLPMPDEVDVGGTVSLPSGQPVKDVTLSFLPAGSNQRPASIPLKADGKFTTKLIPGSYTFLFEGSPSNLKAVPAKYRSADAAHTAVVPAGGTTDLTIKLGN